MEVIAWLNFLEIVGDALKRALPEALAVVVIIVEHLEVGGNLVEAPGIRVCFTIGGLLWWEI